jgi:MraZ protein
VKYLKGEYYHAIDAKSRLTIPAKLREFMSRSEEGYALVTTQLVAVQLFDGILYLYTPQVYEQIAPQFGAELEVNADVRNYKRLRFGLAQEVEVDRLGRVLIPDPLLKRCGLGRDVVILGVENHIEVWPRDRWDGFVEEQLKQHDALASRAIALAQGQRAAAGGAAGAAPGGPPAAEAPKSP